MCCGTDAIANDKNSKQRIMLTTPPELPHRDLVTDRVCPTHHKRGRWSSALQATCVSRSLTGEIRVDFEKRTKEFSQLVKAVFVHAIRAAPPVPFIEISGVFLPIKSLGLVDGTPYSRSLRMSHA